MTLKKRHHTTLYRAQIIFFMRSVLIKMIAHLSLQFTKDGEVSTSCFSSDASGLSGDTCQTLKKTLSGCSLFNLVDEFKNLF